MLDAVGQDRKKKKKWVMNLTEKMRAKGTEKKSMSQGSMSCEMSALGSTWSEQELLLREALDLWLQSRGATCRQWQKQIHGKQNHRLWNKEWESSVEVAEEAFSFRCNHYWKTFF